MTDVPEPLSGSCACVHLACEHRQGKCPEVPVVVEKQLGMPAKLCQTCAERWGFEPIAPLTEDDLVAVVSHVEELRANLLQQANVVIAGTVVTDSKRLVAEIRRLRAEVERLKAEADRG
jgi:hypothetical protein